jgi:hypothetical protein
MKQFLEIIDCRVLTPVAATSSGSIRIDVARVPPPFAVIEGKTC